MDANQDPMSNAPPKIRLARRSKAFAYSPWSTSEELVSRHADPIYFGNGAPAREVQPVERLREAAARAWSDAIGALDYGELQGYEPLREYIAERMEARDMVVSPDELMITNGSQQGIDLIARLLLDPGDSIIVEGPTYIGAMQTFDAYEVDYIVAPVDDDGLDVEALRAQLDETHARPKLVYTVPTFQNPTGVSLSRSRRKALLELAQERGILVLEDDPYGELYFGQKPELPLRACDPNVIYLGTFSKTIAPAIRVGWMTAPRLQMDLLLMAKEAADIHTDRLVTRTVYHAAVGFLDDHVAGLRDHYRLRRDILLSGLEQHLPSDVTWTRPEGGFFVWVTLPEGLDATRLLAVSVQHGVSYLQGCLFYPAGQQRHEGLRLSFSSLPIDRIGEGTRRLGEATRAFLA
jgi:2-aminoadipate transaminase